MIDAIKESIAEYMGMTPDEHYVLGTQLQGLVREHTSAIYKEFDKLEKGLKHLGVSDVDIYQIALMTKVNGFWELLENSNTRQNDLERFVKNVVEETGFNRGVAMELTRNILYSLGIALDAKKEDIINGTLYQKLYTIPGRAYTSELVMFKTHLAKMEQVSTWPTSDIAQENRKKEAMKKLKEEIDFTRLEPLVAASIPKAKYYMAKWCFLLSENEEEKNHAIVLLQEAAAEGDTEAAATLGDYHYEQGKREKAYDHYTGLGSMALTSKRRENLVNILNYRLHNKKVLLFSTIFFVFAVVFLIMAPASNVFHARRLFGCILTILQGGILFLGYKRFIRRPFSNMRLIPAGMFSMWFIYLMIRLFS